MYDPIWQAVAPRLSAERMMEDVRALFEHSRWSSFDRILALARLIAARMEDAGLTDVRLIEFPADGRTAYGGWVLPKAYDVAGATLSVVEGAPAGVLADYQTNPTCLMMYSRPTPPEGITAELAVADRTAECVPERVAGRLVLTSGIGVAHSEAAMRAGAVGVVSDYRGECRFYKEGPFLDDTNEWHNYTVPPWDAPGKGFGFAITPNQGRRLREALAAGQRVRLHAVVQTRHYDGVLPVVSGRLPGRRPDEIAITGHFDEFGADDNCSQVAVAIEAMRALRAMVDAGEIPPLERGVRLLFPMEVRGLNALVQDPSETRHLRLGLNVDTVGTDQNAFTTACTLSESFVALPSFADDFAAELLERVKAENPLFRWHVTEAETIDNILGEPLVGAPTPALWHASATHHLALDTPERLSPRMLRDMARLTATYAAFLANAGLPEALWLAELAADRGARRMAEVAGAALRGGPADAFADRIRQVRSLHERYARKVASAAWLTAAPGFVPTPEAIAGHPHLLSGDDRLFPRDAYLERAGELREELEHARDEAEVRIAGRAKRFAGVPAVAGDDAVPESRLIPVKAFRGFLSFEDLSEEERAYVRDELGIPLGWGAPRWLQNALFFANGARTAGEIAHLLRRHFGHGPDAAALEKVLRFLEARGQVRFRTYVTQTQVEHALRAAGLAEGDTVLGHFSLRRFGYLEGGAEALIGTLLRLLGPEGTLMMPTFTYSWIGHPPFDPARTPSRVGAVTECFRRLPGARRSLHPTHSLAALGPATAELLDAHQPTHSPVGEESPIARLAALDGKVLLFCPRSSNTAMHVGEYRAGVPMPEFACHLLEEGARREVRVPACPWHVRFDAAYARLDAAGLVRDAALGESTLYVVRCRDAIAAQEAVARESPVFLLQPECECEYCRGLREGIDKHAGFE